MLFASTTIEWITSLSAALAAIGTVGALLFGAQAAKSASASATAANEALRYEARPLLLDVPLEPFTDYEHEVPIPGVQRKSAWRGEIAIDVQGAVLSFALPVRNVGRGAALIESVSVTLNGPDVTCTLPSGIALPVGEDRYLPGQPEGPEAARIAEALNEPSWRHGPEPFSFRVVYRGVADTDLQQLQLDVGTNAAGQPNRIRRVTNTTLPASK